MKTKVFMPKYIHDFKCVGGDCVDTCCAGWDINIDSKTYKKYLNSTGEVKKLLHGKYRENKNGNGYFNRGTMILKEDNKCSFLNHLKLCDIHGGIGEENLCITCKSYPRVYNLIDNVYEKSGLPSCHEICIKGFLNKDKMDFIEVDEYINEDDTEIKRILDTEAFEGTDNLIQYFWDIRVISIRIMQIREFTIIKRLNILRSFYKNIEVLHKEDEFEEIEEILETFNYNVSYESLKSYEFLEEDVFYRNIASEELIDKIKSNKLKEFVLLFRKNTAEKKNLNEYLNRKEYLQEFEKLSYILENYLINQIFKDLIPFNKGTDIIRGIDSLINKFNIIKAYVIGYRISSDEEITENLIIGVIQSLSKDIEHNEVFNNLL